MRLKLKKTKSESLQDIINEYLKATKATKVDMNDVAAWAIKNGKWEASRKDAITAGRRRYSDKSRPVFMN